MMSVGDRFKQARNELGLSQKELGEKLNVNKDVIVNIELNRIKNLNQKEPLLKMFCQQFQINYIWLMEGTGKPLLDFPKTVIDDVARIYNLDEEMKEIIIRFIEMSPEDQAVVKRLFFPSTEKEKGGG